MKKILVIDDEAELLEEIVDNLTFNGFEIKGVNQSHCAAEIAKTFVPDIIICDVMMPEVDGYGVLLQMRANPITESIPFIFLTAKGEYESMRHAMGLGANDYLIKPFSFEELINTVNMQLRRHEKIQMHYEQRLENLQQEVANGRDRLSAKSSFLAMVAHDLKTPLAVMLSSVSLMRRYNDQLTEERKQEYLQRMEGTIADMVQMIDDLLSISRADHDTLELHFEPVDLCTLCDSVIHWLHPPERQTHVVEFLECVKSLVIDADEKLLRQALINLLSNALKYSPAGSRVTVQVKQSHNGMAHITIDDQGIGIPDEDQQRLFHAFQRASNTRETKGTGIGLTVVKLVAELHHGYVSLQSVQGKGTTAQLSLPFAHHVSEAT